MVKKISKQCFWSWPLVVLQIVLFFPSLPGMNDHDDPMYNVTNIFQVEKSRKFHMFQ